MKRLFFILPLLTAGIIFAGCSKQTAETAPTDSETTTTTPTIRKSIADEVDMSGQTNETINVTNLTLSNGTVIKLKLLTPTNEVFGQSETIVFDASDVSVDSTGNATMKVKLAVDNKIMKANPDYAKVLYEISPDSLGNETEMEIWRE